MPELPEVETVRRGLLPAMEGEVIEQAEVRRDGLRWKFPENMAGRLSGARVSALRRRSKYILADLDTDETLIIHLGMSGRMQVSGVKIGDFFHDHQEEQKHDHVVLHMSGGGRVTFNDARRFGAMDLAPTGDVDQHKMLAGLGPEPLGNDFHEDLLKDRFKRRKTPVKSALLDQKIVAGLGNIYVCEALWPFLSTLLINLVETNVNYIVEGEILPKHVHEFIESHGVTVSACFVGYKDMSVDEKVKQVRANKGHPNDWTSALSHNDLSHLIQQGIQYSEYLYSECQKFGIRYIDFSVDFEMGKKTVLDYLVRDFQH